MAVDFLKRGKSAHEAIAKADHEAEVRQAQYAIRRFWIPKDGETQITFLDGALTPEGLLDTTTYLEHQVFMNGNWKNWFPCVSEVEPCPICESNNYHSVVSLFTVIDHSQYTDRNGKVHKNERRLFAAKRDTLKRLQKLATRPGRSGLLGWTVGVSRTGDKSAGVGSDFEFLEHNSIQDLVKKYGLNPQEAVPFNYADGKTVVYRTADQLRQLGFGGPVIGNSGGGGSTWGGQDSAPFDEEL